MVVEVVEDAGVVVVDATGALVDVVVLTGVLVVVVVRGAAVVVVVVAAGQPALKIRDLHEACGPRTHRGCGPGSTGPVPPPAPAARPRRCTRPRSLARNLAGAPQGPGSTR